MHEYFIQVEILKHIRNKLKFTRMQYREDRPILKFGSGRGSSVIYIDGEYLCISTWLGNTIIDLNSCGDPAIAAREFILTGVHLRKV
jgi:hypothetical protein